MKRRIFKLRSELAFFSVISVVITLLILVITRDIIFNSYAIQYRENIQYEVYDKVTTEIKYKFNNVNNDFELNKLLESEFNAINRSFFIVQKDGTVLKSNTQGIKSIDASEVVDSKQAFKAANNRSNEIRITGCYRLKDGRYLYYVLLEQVSSDIISHLTDIAILIVFTIVFFLLIWRRISYISKIKSSVRSIAAGNLSERVPLRYKNELRELAEDINYMVSELEKEDKKRSEFLTNISHDLRTPLTTILGYINIIKNSKYASKDELNNYVDIMIKKGSHLKNMLDDFFQFSKLSSKDIVLEKQKLELNELARQIADEEENEFIQNGLELSLKLPQESIYIDVDCSLFLRAISNLLNNALKYSKRNTKVEFYISKEKYNNKFYAVISVSNIAENTIIDDEIESFFERLYKKDLSRQNGGSGLGLSIVKDIIKLHHGFVKAYKENDRLYFQIYIKESRGGA